MTTRHITTRHEQDVCDICGRTLLRGEHTEAFLDGPRRYSVCELCKPHALHEGWVREGTIPDFQGLGQSSARRRSLLGRFRGGRGHGNGIDAGTDDPPAPQTLDDELSLVDPPAPQPVKAPAPARGSDRQGRERGRRERSRPEQQREPRHVHAVPSSDDHKFAAALEVFNRSEHTRTIAGVARSLGAPDVSLTPDHVRPPVVWVVAAWELCWYRYEVDLSDDPGSVRLDAQGYELGELAEAERIANATADEAGRLAFA